MFLKRLEIHGFKTFSSKTSLEFNGGLTAIVGPNGSGKSNVADAIRWVLGEQNPRILRCKKGDDVIFAGGPNRSRAGLAEVAIEFDNSTGFLDTPFNDVIVTRRLDRSGQSDYLLNGTRVRLRDLVDLLVKGGISPNGYTVIGQGMVDLALSLRPEERRALFEDAAGIRHHQTRLSDARSRLDSTDANLARVRDVIAEIEPRLKSLERRARQLRERDSVRAELRSHLAGWYGHRWLAIRAEVDAAGAAARSAADDLTDARLNIEATFEEAAELDARQGSLRVRLEETERSRLDLNGQIDRVERDLALARQRSGSTRARAVELRDEIDAFHERARDDEAAAFVAREQIERLDSDIGLLSEQLVEAESTNEARREGLDALRAQLAQAENAIARLEGERSQLVAELGRIGDRRRAIAEENADLIGAIQRDEEKLLAVQADVDRAKARRTELTHEIAAQDSAIEKGRAELAENRAEQEAAAARLADIGRLRAGVQGRLDVLNDSRDGYAGYYAGVRSVLAAARADRRAGTAPKLDGVIGLVASLVDVPAELEQAIEVALGGHLQDIVVERWEHAEAAVALLKKTNGGRATFLPLDTLRGAPRRDAPMLAAGVRGVAADLVRYDPRYAIVIEHLLGRTLVVDDLEVARRTLAQLAGSWQIVTVAGEIVRSNGAVTGGSREGGDRTLLARERERRDLPRRLATLSDDANSAQAALAAARKAQRELDEDLQQTIRSRRDADHALVTAREEGAALDARVERLRREIEWSSVSMRRTVGEVEELDRRERDTRARLASLPTERNGSTTVVVALRDRLDALQSATREQSERVSVFRNNVSLIEGERRAQTRLLEGYADRRSELDQAVEARRRRIDELIGEAAALDGDAEELGAARRAVEDQRESLEGERRPVEIEIAAIDEQVRVIRSGEAAARAQLDRLADIAREHAIAAGAARERLIAHGREARLALAEAEPERLAPTEAGSDSVASESGDGDSSVDETALVAAEAAFGDGASERAALAKVGSVLPPTELIYEPLADPQQSWRRIESLRNRLRAIGAVDATAGQEFDEAFGRHAFLTGQAADLTDAQRGLREVIAELETAMQRQFDAAFEAIGLAFRKHFTALFGGGTARLTLAESESGSPPGVDIIAQPPGKRAQSLSLLSGGERALTAVAILFAILDVNPTPICILDEVDAALDDANIVRFAKTLRELSARTQFVVITHNRGTMEAADALFGVTMIDRSISRTVSLRLADVPA